MRANKGYFNKMNRILAFTGKGKMILIIFGICISSCLELLGVSIIYPFIDMLLASDSEEPSGLLLRLSEILNLEPVWTITILVIALYLVKNIFILFYNRFEIKTFYKLQSDLATKLMHTYMQQPYTFFLKENSATLLRGVQWDVPQFCSALRSLMVICSHSMLAVLLIGLLLVTDVKLTIVMLAVIGACMILFYYTFRKKAQYYGAQTQEAYKEIYQWSDEAIGGMKEIKVMRREPFFVKGFVSVYDKFSDASGMFSFLNLFPRLILEVVCITAIVLVIVFELKGGRRATEYIPALSVFAMAFFRMFPRIGEISTSYNNVMYSKASVEAVYDILDRMREADVVSETECTKEIIRFEEELEVRNLSYVYEGSNRKILDKINLSIPKGSAVAVTGASGAGKTTFINVLLGLLTPQEGGIYCDGKDISQAEESFWQQIGYIPQMIFIADDTIRNNVVFGAHPYDSSRDEEVWNALEEAKIADLVRSLPDGLDATIGENGVRLSGGERQRLGIARALYHRPEILIMDEATSALDKDTEKAVIDTIAGLKGKKTLIIIAHRLSTIKDCDVIYKMEDGMLEKTAYQEL